jgi:hypothetical protein
MRVFELPTWLRATQAGEDACAPSTEVSDYFHSFGRLGHFPFRAKLRTIFFQQANLAFPLDPPSKDSFCNSVPLLNERSFSNMLAY